MPESSSGSTLSERLSDIRDKRGYLLPHHGLLAISTEGLLDAYDELYSRLTLLPRYLSKHDHEYVWMAVLIASCERLGTHHIPRFLDAGGTDEELADIVALTALAKGSDTYSFVEQHWLPHLPTFKPENAYLQAFRQAVGASALPLAHMAASAVHTCLGNWPVLKWQILAAYEDNTAEAGLAEALSLAMFPGSVPSYVKAAEVWRKLIVDQEVAASNEFQCWARTTGQGGYDEASGVVAVKP
jgi:alkylhydroperoxidase/carboxymuconolactone decarboxylase family protein YurZ